MVDVRALLSDFSRRLAPLDRAANEAWWAASTDVSEAHEAARVVADLALRDALSDRAVFADLSAAASTDDADLHREIAVLRDRMQPHQVSETTRDELVRLEAKLDGVFNSFRPDLDGVAVADNVIAEVLRSSSDVAERERAWRASKAIGPVVADQIRELAHVRNRSARELGTRDFFELTLATSELDEARLFETLVAVDEATRAPFVAWKEAEDRHRAERFGCNPDELRPWHYDDPFFQAAPAPDDLDLDAWLGDADLEALTRATYSGVGIDIESVLAHSDLLPRPGKSQHAFCIDIDRRGDVRVLCNNVAGSYWAETMLHEFGHAAYDVGVSPDLPLVLRTMHPLTTEGIAMLFGRLTLDPEWLETIAGVSSETVRAARPALAARRRVGLLMFARWVLVMTHFERGLYADPDADHDTRWWDLVEEYQLVCRPENRHEPDWASKIHVALAPVYYQNYLLGELVASHLQAHVMARYGGIVNRPEAGSFFRREIFAPGWRLRWDQLIATATGSRLSVDAFRSELVALERASVEPRV